MVSVEISMRYTVTLLHKHDWEPMSWAKENCPSYISNTGFLHEDKNDSSIEYYFVDEKDAFWFKMRWE